MDHKIKPYVSKGETERDLMYPRETERDLMYTGGDRETQSQQETGGQRKTERDTYFTSTNI